MSRETSEWLNTHTLHGFGRVPWHHDGSSDNVYTGAIPVGDVKRRLFDWDAVEAPLTARVPVPLGSTECDGLTDDGYPVANVPVPGRKAIVHGVTHQVLGVHSQSYAIHQFHEWLTGGLSNLVGDTIGIGSAGLLKGGAVAWVQIETPDSVTAPGGVTFYPRILACTSHDGTLATTFRPVVTVVVCDNTLSAAMAEDTPVYRVKHTRNSTLRVEDARAALGMITQTASAVSDTIGQLVQTSVSPAQWGKFLDKYVPVPPEPGRGRTMAEAKRYQLQELWTEDVRAATWQGTAFGVLQVVNTWGNHVQGTRGEVERPERNLLKVLDGTQHKNDMSALKILAGVLR